MGCSPRAQQSGHAAPDDLDFLRLGRAPAVLSWPHQPLLSAIHTCAKAASRAYLRRALGREPKFADLFRHFHSFASTIHDRVFLLNGRFDLFQVEMHGKAVIDEVLAAGRGAILMGAHMGSFEVVRAIGRQQPDLRVAMVMYAENARKLNAALAAINPAAVQDIIPWGRSTRCCGCRPAWTRAWPSACWATAPSVATPPCASPFWGGCRVSYRPHAPGRHAEAPGAVHERPLSGGSRYAIHFERLADFSDLERSGRDAAIQSAVATYAACWNAIAAPRPTTGSISSISGARRLPAKP